MLLILSFVKMADDGQLTETLHQANNKIKYIVVFDRNQTIFDVF